MNKSISKRILCMFLVLITCFPFAVYAKEAFDMKLLIDNVLMIHSRPVKIKENVVAQDPTEKGIRKALNLGHTFGHALESWSLKRTPILHGYAVAYGIICELYLSCIKVGFPTDKMRQTVSYIRENYGALPITCDDYDELIQLMTHDKKNTAGTINFTLLADIGDIRIDQTATIEEIKEALDFLREG